MKLNLVRTPAIAICGRHVTLELPEHICLHEDMPIFITQNPDIAPDVTQLFYTTPELERCTITSLNLDTRRDFAGVHVTGTTTIELAGIHALDPAKPLYITQNPGNV